MELKPHIAELVRIYHDSESSLCRGPCFKELALALEREMQEHGLTTQALLSCLGPPDLFEGDGLYVYYFDHDEAGRNRHEWYFHCEQGTLVSSGYNERGINDTSSLQRGSSFRSVDDDDT